MGDIFLMALKVDTILMLPSVFLSIFSPSR